MSLSHGSTSIGWRVARCQLLPVSTHPAWAKVRTRRRSRRRAPSTVRPPAHPPAARASRGARSSANWGRWVYRLGPATMERSCPLATTMGWGPTRQLSRIAPRWGGPSISDPFALRGQRRSRAISCSALLVAPVT